MRKWILILCCFLAAMIVLIPSASANLVHSASYTWYSTGGTVIGQTVPTTETTVVGDVSGDPLIKIEEDVWDKAQAESLASSKSITLPSAINNAFQYTVTVLKSGFPNVTSLHIPNMGVAAVAFAVPPSGGPWSFTNNVGGFYVWSTTGTGIAWGSGGIDNFIVWVNQPVADGWAISTGEVDKSDGTITAKGLVSHPTPEPGTLTLLGLGIVGLVGSARKRKKT